MREEYLKIREEFKRGYIPMQFIERYCRDKGKDIMVVNEVLDFVSNDSFGRVLQKNVLETMINHFDYTFKLQILFNKENKEIKWS